MPSDPAARIAELSKELLRHQYLYYVKAQPAVPDAEYDRLFDELVALEAAHPELAAPDSPTRRVGSDLDHELPEVAHSIPVLSLDKCYNFEDLSGWIEKTVKHAGTALSVVVEEKLDGSSIVLYYEQGRLARAVTRGNGAVGNDVTENVKTIGAVPLVLAEPVDVVARGEIFLPKEKFAALNQAADGAYANPRNLAAGVVRSVKSSAVARVPLDIFVYEGFFPSGERDHVEILHELARLGFKTNPSLGYFSDDETLLAKARALHPAWHCAPIADLEHYVEKKDDARAGLPYEIDGLVIKVNETAVREALGYTSHHPRWAVAWKFEAPQAVTKLLDITPQVGRNGRITPVAELEPVLLAGSTIARATLHNEDYITALELALGDTVAISKRGDVIPAVERVVEPNADGHAIWTFPLECPACAQHLVKDGAHHYCKNRYCPGRVLGGLVHFTGKTGLDIEGLGEKTVHLLHEKGFVHSCADFYEFNWELLAVQDGFGPKKVENIKAGLETSLKKPFRSLLVALGIEGLGKKAAELLVENNFESMDKILAAVDADEWERFAGIEGFGELTAKQLVREFSDEDTRGLIARLAQLGLPMAEERQAGEELPQTMAGQRWCVTGSFERWTPRELAMEEVKKRGGAVVSGVTSKTTHLLAGAGGGSKLKKAQELDVAVVDEATFAKMLEG